MFALFDASPVAANAVAFVIATVFSYLANTLWSFSATVQWSNLIRFLAVAAAGLIETMMLAHGLSLIHI